MKLLKSLLRSSSHLVDLYRSWWTVLTAVLFFALPVLATKNSAKPPRENTKSEAAYENYQDLIAKAQNLTLQRDRLQASQILIRALKRESRSSVAFREMSKALTDLSLLFYTEKAQDAYSLGDSAVEAKPREAIDNFQEALRLEDGNVSTLIALARVHLTLNECDKADVSIRAAEAIDPYSATLRLLTLQSLACAKNFEGVLSKLDEPDGEGDEVALKNSRFGLQILALTSKTKPDLKKAKAVLALWEAADPGYPETYYWTYQIAKLGGGADRSAAVKYSQACQNLTARKRKSYSTDVNLCKWKDAVDAYLKESGPSIAPPEPR